MIEPIAAVVAGPDPDKAAKDQMEEPKIETKEDIVPKKKN